MTTPTPRTRSPRCTNKWCVPDFAECPDCIEHNGPTPYQIEQELHRQLPILTPEDFRAFRERLGRELCGCTISGDWTPGGKSTLRVTGPTGQRGYVRVRPNGMVEYTRPELWGMPTHPTWLLFDWVDPHAHLFGPIDDADKQ